MKTLLRERDREGEGSSKEQSCGKENSLTEWNRGRWR